MRGYGCSSPLHTFLLFLRGELGDGTTDAHEWINLSRMRRAQRHRSWQHGLPPNLQQSRCVEPCCHAASNAIGDAFEAR